MGSRPDGWWRDRPGAARRLVEQLQSLPEDRVVVVLEGAFRAGAAAGRHGRVEVVHAPGSGDDALVERAGPGCVVVTADRELGQRVRATGAEVSGPRHLLARLTP